MERNYLCYDLNMNNMIMKFYELNHNILALYIQAFATIMIGILAWTAACGQNRISEKSAKRDLFKLRYNNLYREVDLLFENCNALVEEYTAVILNKKGKKKRTLEIENIRSNYSKIRNNFDRKMQFNQFLIKPKDFDKLDSFCREYITEVVNYIYDIKNERIYPPSVLTEKYQEHLDIIKKILSPYLLSENENILFFYFYKIKKYLKRHIRLFLIDYFPTFFENIGSTILIILLILGVIWYIIELIKEILKGTISFNNGRVSLKLKLKSAYLERNRPWPL